MKRPKAAVLHAAGTNRDPDARDALLLAGADPEIVHVNQLRFGQKRLDDYRLLVIPGGFSYADALGAGKLFALDLASYFADQVAEFVASGRPVIGICNGFQVLVKAGVLPGAAPAAAQGGLAGQTRPMGAERAATLTRNQNGRFECRLSTMAAPASKCVWTKGLEAPITCPIAHGEGRFLVDSEPTMEGLKERGQIALVYSADGKAPAGGAYPANPNGSVADIAGVCDPGGTVLGLMPHPENNVLVRARDGEARRAATEACLKLWKNGVDWAAGL